MGCIADKYKPDATFRFELKNFTEFAKGHEQQRLSPSTYVRGLPWYCNRCVLM
jgi:hypothetical protein